MLMKIIVLRINKDLPNYLRHFTKVGILILLLIIYGSAFVQKNMIFRSVSMEKEHQSFLFQDIVVVEPYGQKLLIT